MHPAAWWQPYLPLVVIALVLLFRLARMNRPRRMHLGRLLVGPVILGLLAIYLFVSMPPDLTGVAVFAGGAAAGGALGWQRARLMKIVYDSASDTFTLQQSPWAVALLISVVVLRRLVLMGMAGQGIASQGMNPHSAGAMWVFDGIIGFGLGTVVARNAELWLRAKALRVATLSGTFA